MVLKQFEALFLDVGGVLLTNGWDHHMRQRASDVFNINNEEINQRHALIFNTYEIGKISLDDYLNRAVFYEPRPFSLDQFKEFMFSQNEAYPHVIELIRSFKEQYGLKAVALSNEGRELTQYRIQTFKLKEFIDIFIFSCFVHLRKPDVEIYQMALDIAQVEPGQVIYIDDRPMLVEIANSLGMKGIHHVGVESTRSALLELFE